MSRDEHSHGEHGESASGGLLDNVLVRLGLYYTSIIGFFLLIVRFAPGFIEALARERARHALAVDTDNISVSDINMLFGPGAPLSGEISLVAGTSMVMALLMALPVAWVYGWTSTSKSYSRGFAQSLLIFPVAVALVVFLVKGSLALAFSLAGIVAAVRFRSVLPQTRDAVFLFLVIGIGLSAGVQLVPVALIASVIFNLTMITITIVDFGSKPRRMRGLSLEPARPRGGEGSVRVSPRP
jgi:hypothetical protein